jgi:hypothetical protein
MGVKCASLLMCAAIAFTAVSAFAHHPFSAEYDWKKPVTLTGTVTKLDWTNPHAILHVDAKDADGKQMNWTLEMGSVAALTRAGWNRDTVKAGDQVTVDAWLAKSGTGRANVKSVKLPSGQELSAASSFADTLVKPKGAE